MSDAPSQEQLPGEQPEHDSATAARKKSPVVLRIVLMAILLLSLVLLVYDRYARAACNAAFQKVEQWVKEEAEKSPEDVRELLGRQPDDGLENYDHYFQETYSWRRGSLVKTYFVKVLYHQKGERLLLHEVVQNVEPGGTDIPELPEEASAPADGEPSPPDSDE